MSGAPQRLVFAHIGDLHIVDARQQNAADLLSIVAQLEIECGRQLGFVVLPGDNADNGRPSQYAIIATALKMLSAPWIAIPGDHDMGSGSLEAFQRELMPDPLPMSVMVAGMRCLFLDLSGGGTGGPDFRLGGEQLAWLATELVEARRYEQGSVLFMHTYPADLHGEGETEALTQLIAENALVLVDMGHTHYNELAHDGCTIFAATRSTGQIEEGPVGYALTTIDDGIVSWRFKLLAEPFPFVMITAPADYRLMRGADQITTGRFTIRAIVFGRNAPVRVEARIEDGDWIAMAAESGGGWQIELEAPSVEQFGIAVRAFDSTGRPGIHTIRPAGKGFRYREHKPVGSDAASIGAWPENGIFGTQLGPNRNAKPIGGKAS